LGDRFGDVGMVWSDSPYGISIVATNGYVGGGECNRTSIEDCQERKRLGTSNGSKPFGSKDVRGSVGTSNIVEVNKYAPIIGDDTTETARKSFEVCKLFPDSIQFWWGANYYDFLPASSCWIVWDKENTGNFADAELAWCNHKSAVRIFKHQWNGMIKASERGEKRVHPTQKPVALCEWCFEKYGKPDDVIFDPFLGSGISIIAAQKMEGDRIVYGFELSPAYCEIILQRFEKLTGIEPKLIGRLPD
jgi:DNA methylase